MQLFIKRQNHSSFKTRIWFILLAQLSANNFTSTSTFQSHRRGAFLLRYDRQSIGLSLSVPVTIQRVELQQRSYATRHNSKRRRRVVAVHFSKSTHHLVD